MSVTPSEADRELAGRWWSALRGEIPADVRGLWFGLTDLVTDGLARRTLYVAGCPDFDPEDETAEWACEQSWLPEGRYVSPPGLAALPEQPYQRVLEYAAALVADLDLSPLADSACPEPLGVAVGFDDGDFVVIAPAESAPPE